MIFEIREKIGLVRFGCYRITKVNLIERYNKPTKNIISIDGIQIYKYNIEYLIKIIGYI